MKAAVIFSVPEATSFGYCWRWRSVDGRVDSEKQFAYYYDCLTHASEAGYTAQLAVARGNTAPSWGSLTEQSHVE